MPGTYAHLTLVNEVKEPHRLEAQPGFTKDAIAAVLEHVKFIELGAVSPDYPYLAVGNAASARWADAMHYERTGQVIHAGVSHLRQLAGAAKRKGFAWLLGYAAHVGTDVTIHPVVNLKVGPYEQNKTAHRRCEMHQDAYIWQRMNLSGVGISEHLDSGIGTCGDGDQFDADIGAMWAAMLRAVHPDQYGASPPDFHLWHQRFRQTVDNMAEEGYRLPALARHVVAGQGLTYPNFGEVDPQYIRSLKVPTGVMDYDQIFDDAAKSVLGIWSALSAAVWQGDESFRKVIGDWNLDTGMDPAGRLVFWGKWS